MRLGALMDERAADSLSIVSSADAVWNATEDLRRRPSSVGLSGRSIWAASPFHASPNASSFCSSFEIVDGICVLLAMETAMAY